MIKSLQILPVFIIPYLVIAIVVVRHCTVLSLRRYPSMTQTKLAPHAGTWWPFESHAPYAEIHLVLVDESFMCFKKLNLLLFMGMKIGGYNRKTNNVPRDSWLK